MHQDYNPQKIETEIQKKWIKDKVFKAAEDSDKEKFYCLEMFPYPSGKLHMGHVRNYTIGDVISRYQRLLGKNVLHPMGWDGFGLPAENAAIANKTAPAEWTEQNIANMREQLKRLGFSYDWDREFATCEPSYYRWEQWFFTQLYERDLVYKKEAEVNWDPVDQTVLANEQVIDGRGWRSGALVEKKKIPQWFIKITDYAEELLSSLDDLEGWPDSVKTMQRNWIGKSVGADIVFTVEGSDDLKVFTTRPDTIFGATYLAVAADHPLAIKASESNKKVAEFRTQCQQTSTAEADLETMEKLGVDLGITAKNPVSGEDTPVWCANFVLMSYGTGAVMSVPAHDQRDFEFASKYGINIKQVIAPSKKQETKADLNKEAFTEYGVLVNSAAYDGQSSEEAKKSITLYLEKNNLGSQQINYRLRDWGVSRQRYWGCPIPMIYDENGEASPANEFPVELPTDVVMDGVGSPIKKMRSFIDTINPHTGQPAERETDTFDTFFESSWYYARYCCADLDSAMLDERANHWLPVDQYVGGIEHAVMHLLYARFFHKLMRDVGLLDSDEPFIKLLTQGMVTAETYYRNDESGKREFFNPIEVDLELDDKGVVLGAALKSDGSAVEVGGVEKMSKSKNNGVDPQSMIERFGADTVRLFTMFAAPPDQSLEWNDDAIAGASRFLRRLWNFFHKHQSSLSAYRLQAFKAKQDINSTAKDLRRVTHTIMQRVLRDFERQQFNTVVAAAMELTNAAEKADWSAMGEDSDSVLSEICYTLVKMLAPITPHLSEHLWQLFGEKDKTFDGVWLALDESALVKDQVTYVIQVNGKLRAKLEVSAALQKDEIENLALSDENVQRFLDGVSVRKVILVPNKLVNIVAN